MKRLFFTIVLSLLISSAALGMHKTSNHILINEVKTVGEDHFLDEFVELLNVSDALFDIGGYSLIYYRKDGLPCGTSETIMGEGKLYPVLYTFPEGTIIQPYHYYLLASPHCSESKTADAVMGEDLLSDGQLILVDSTLTDTLDAVSWGRIDVVVTNEGLPAKYLEPTGGPPVSPDLISSTPWSIQRDPEGGDTNDSYADFAMRSFTTPMNSQDSIKLVLPNSLKATVEEQSVVIRWKTLSRTLDLSFDICRRTIGEDQWDVISPGAALFHEAKDDTNYYRYCTESIDVDRIYEFRIKETDFSGGARYSDVIAVNAKALILEQSPDSDMKPESFTLAQNYPNPFNPQTHVRISLLEPAQISLIIYNLAGQKIRSLFEGNKEPGVYSYSWHGVDDNRIGVPSGEYICVLKAENTFIQARKMVFLK